MRAIASGAVFVLSFAASADAAPPRHSPASKKAEQATSPPPSVSLTVDAPSPTGPWKVRVENTGTVPLRLTADARLVSFEIERAEATSAKRATSKGKAPKPLRCALPADMRPTNDTDRALVLPPKRSYSEAIDPRLYCFGAEEAKALVPGARIVATMGFASSHAAKKTNEAPPPPYVVSPFEGVEPAVAPLKEITSAPVTVGGGEPATPASSAPAPSSSAPTEAFPPKLTLSIPARERTADVRDVTIPVTLQNVGPRPVTVLFRPESLGFEVLGPEGPVRCAWPQPVGGSVRELYTHLPPKGRTSIAVLLSAYCAPGTFDHPGIYTLRPRLDTRGSDAAQIGVDAFTGEIIGDKTMLLRVERGRTAHTERPRLDPQ